MEEISNAPCPGLPQPDYLARQANRLRQKLRPDDPKDLDFDLEEEHIPTGFLWSDLGAHSRRHLIFATDEQLHDQARSKSWYIDSTFKVCRHPFMQLLSINAFVGKDHVRQVSLLLVLMSAHKE